MSTRHATVYWTLLVVTVLQATAAVLGGIALIATDGLGMPATMLQNSPFHSFLWPGLILLVVVGGTQVTAAIALVRRADSADFWAAVAGLGMIIWIFVETMLVSEPSWLQPLFFATGVIQLALVLVLEGITRSVPGPGSHHRRVTWRARR